MDILKFSGKTVFDCNKNCQKGKLNFPVLLDFTMTANNLPSPFVASASSEFPGYSAYHAFDNNDGTDWSSLYTTGDPYPMNIKIDLGQIFLITGVKIKASDNGMERQCIKTGNCSISKNDISYTTAHAFSGEANWGEFEERTYFFPSINGRYLNLQIDSTQEGNISAINQMSIYILG